MSAPSVPARILVVDDEEQIRRFLRISLKSQGYQVLEAATAAAGLALAATATPDLVVLDLGLPDADGKAVLRELRAWSTVPLIVLSVRDAEAEKVLALDGGADDYVTKPFGIGEFLARVRNLLRTGGQSEEPAAHFGDGHLCIDLARRLITREGSPVHLTPDRDWRRLPLHRSLRRAKRVARMRGRRPRALTKRCLRRQPVDFAAARSPNWLGVRSRPPCAYLRQNCGVNRIKSEKTSSRPSNIVNARTQL